ncbi:YggL family protein [Pseudomonas aeruginosa]|uniref:YggL 50S ribosome-binding family protein n=1 Tax=Pseudomonas aeruginosa TaxID=287 RepID=UPI00148DAC59|nr:50S ribosome-binding protein YggL [Pseudomonas aeruginosa]
MATNRSRRLRKKLCVDEFQEPGFELNFHYKEGVDADAVNAFMLRFIDQAIEANELTYGGCDEFGFVCLARRGSVNEEQRALIEAWLKQQPELASVEVGALVDAWYPEQPVLPKL